MERLMFVCQKCNEESPIWERTCPTCSSELSLIKKTPIIVSQNIDTQVKKSEHLKTGFPFFDIIFKGFLRSFVYYLSAERGAGKTTFLLQVCNYLVSAGKKVLYFSLDEGEIGIMKKCMQYKIKSDMINFFFNNNFGIVERSINQFHPDFVVLDSLQSYAQYKNEIIVSTLYRFSKEAQAQRFSAVVIGEQRKDGKDYLGSASISHIADVLMKLEKGINDEIIISTPQKNRDTDDRTSRAFFKRTLSGLVEIKECETGYKHRHNEKKIIGLASFVTNDVNKYSIDEITAVTLENNKKYSSLIISGMTSSKAKNLLTVIQKIVMITDMDILLRANNMDMLHSDTELACIVAALSSVMDKPVSVDTVFIGSVDNRGYLLPVNGMEQRIKRAKALGYSRIIGPKATGSQTASWDEFETILSLKRELLE
jgi:DNA repair protein RadA/Sms